jgi:hypothetical protein
LYKVPKEKSLVLVKMPPMPPEWKTVFISSCAETHRGRETVSDLFNTPRKFFPLLDEREGIVLVRRNAIRWVRVEDPERFEWYYYEVRQGAPRSTVRCSFEDGEVLEGTLYAVGPAGEQRVQDVVNRQEGFVQLETGTGLFLVNLVHITALTVRAHARISSQNSRSDSGWIWSI